MVLFSSDVDIASSHAEIGTSLHKPSGQGDHYAAPTSPSSRPRDQDRLSSSVLSGFVSCFFVHLWLKDSRFLSVPPGRPGQSRRPSSRSRVPPRAPAGYSQPFENRAARLGK